MASLSRKYIAGAWRAAGVQPILTGSRFGKSKPLDVPRGDSGLTSSAFRFLSILSAVLMNP